MGSWLLEHYKPLRTEHAKTSLHTQHHTHLTKTGCLAWTVSSCSQDSRDHLQANLPNSEHTSLTLIPVKNLALQPPQVKLCNSNLEFLPVTTSTWPELPLMVGPTLIPSCGHKTTQGRRTRSPLLGLSHCSSLSGGGNPLPGTSLNSLLYPCTHSPALHKLSRTTESSMYLYTWLSMCLPPTQSLSPERYSKVDLGASTSQGAYNTWLPVLPAPTSSTQAFWTIPCRPLTHTSKSSP